MGQTDLSRIWIKKNFFVQLEDLTQGSRTILSSINWAQFQSLMMEEKKKSSRSRLRLFPSFSVKTGVFNKQVSSMSMRTTTMVVMKRMIMFATL